MSPIIYTISVVLIFAFIEAQWAKKRGLSLYSRGQTRIALLLIAGQLIVSLTLMAYLYKAIRIPAEDKWFVLPNHLFWHICAFLMLDFFAYWNHRLSHAFSFFWADHAVHHANTEYNLITNLTHGWTSFVSAGLLISLLVNLIGNMGGVSVVYFVATTIVGTIAHTQLIHKLGFLEYFMTTPSHHRMHHAIDRQTHDCNYGNVLIIWDKMFGTFKPEGNKHATQFGLAYSPKLQAPVWEHAFFAWKAFFDEFSKKPKKPKNLAKS